ncbi:hypothetical protein D3C76_1564510 [compost metagenome]
MYGMSFIIAEIESSINKLDLRARMVDLYLSLLSMQKISSCFSFWSPLLGTLFFGSRAHSIENLLIKSVMESHSESIDLSSNCSSSIVTGILFNLDFSDLSLDSRSLSS